MAITNYDAALDYDAILDYDGVTNIVVSSPNTGSGSGNKKKKRKNKIYYAPSSIAEIVKRYNEKLSPPQPEIQAVAAYIDKLPPKTDVNNLAAARDIALSLYGVLPEVERLDFENFFGNYLAIEKLNAKDRENKRIIEERLKAQYDADTDMMIIILASL